MVLLLYLACILVPVAVVVRHCFRPDGIRVDPVLTFSIGFVVYWLFPIALGASGAFASQAGMDLWYGLFQRTERGVLLRFAAVSLTAYAAFVFGFLHGSRRGHERPRRALHFSPALLAPLFVVLLVAAAGFAFALRDRLFHGYRTTEIIGNGGIQGSFVAVSLALLALAMLRLSWRALRAEIDLVRYVRRDGFFLGYFAVAVLALSLGGRLYFVSSLLILATYRSTFDQPVQYGTFLLGGVATVLLAGVVGVVRLGGRVNPSAVAFNLAAEPMFTSFSLVNFLAVGHFGVFRAPIFLVSDFVNLIPTVVFPAKQRLLLDPSQAGFEVFAPIGALNSFFSFMINFGALGTPLALYGLGTGLRLLRGRSDSPVARTAYCMLTGFLAFTFFRDPFAVSVVKNMFEFSLAVPALFAAVAHVFTVITDEGRAGDVPPAHVPCAP